jgi:hypothetical protein
MIEEDNFKKILEDHERRITALESKEISQEETQKLDWYRPGSTTDKVVMLVHSGFFKTAQSLSDILNELQRRDYHLQASDLTLPIRRIVRKGLLKKTKELPDGSRIKKWHYIQE